MKIKTNLGTKKIQTPLQKFKTLFRARIKIKKLHRVIELEQTAFL